MSKILLFDGIENRYDVSQGKYCLKKSRDFFREQAMERIYFKK